MTKTLAEGTKPCDRFKPTSLLTRLFLGLLAAPSVKPGLRPFVATTPAREATHSARHDRRAGRYVGPVCRTINQGRSRPCPCGSGKKYKRCHLSIDVAARVQMSGKSRPTGVRLGAA